MISSRLTRRDSLLFVYGTLRPFADVEMAKWLHGNARYLGSATTQGRLYDLGELRYSEMDEAGIDVLLVSHGAPSAQKLSGADAADITRGVNDRLHAVEAANP